MGKNTFRNFVFAPCDEGRGSISFRLLAADDFGSQPRDEESKKKILQEKQYKALTDADNVGYHVGPTETTVARDEHLTVRRFLRKSLSEVVN